MTFSADHAYARSLDATDPLKAFRERFIVPRTEAGESVYLLGNSLGLQPKATKQYIDGILNDWAALGVESFFAAKEPWMDYHDHLVKPLAAITGALPSEIVVMNQLTVNLHLMMVSFYRPTATRYKIICEAKAFPSDQYALETQVRAHGIDPAEVIIEVKPREGELTLRTEDIIAVIGLHGAGAALVMFSGINYYTGQVFDMKAICEAAIAAGARVGLDLAHAAGNIELDLHAWGADFACWCSYKYLNAGPGAIGGVFIHEKNHDDNIPRFAGWWGYDKATRFRMEQGFKPMPGAEGWQLSTPALFLYAAHRASLAIIGDAGWQAIQDKRQKLSEYAWQLLEHVNRQSNQPPLRFITPREPHAHGSQISLQIDEGGRQVYECLLQQHIFVDWREPDVMRLAPVPLYNSYEDVWRFADALSRLC